jgi:hypothetical protein
MTPILWLAALCAVFAACRWSGLLLDRHYADRAEFGAVGLVGLCIVGAALLGAGAATLWGLPVRLLLGCAITGGLLVGRARIT